jgi:hypothetical protein
MAVRRPFISMPPAEPPNVDDAAKKYRSGRYQPVRTMQECRIVLTQMPVMVSIEITNKWFDAPGGRTHPTSDTDVPAGSHTVLLRGFDNSKAEFKFQNSWALRGAIRGSATSHTKCSRRLGARAGCRIWSEMPRRTSRDLESQSADGELWSTVAAHCTVANL